MRMLLLHDDRLLRCFNLKAGVVVGLLARGTAYDSALFSFVISL